MNSHLQWLELMNLFGQGSSILVVEIKVLLESEP